MTDMKRKSVLMASSFVLLTSVLSAGFTAGAKPELPFTDVKAGDWYYEAVASAYDNGIMNGRSENEFVPGETMTRAEVITILSRLTGDAVDGKGKYARCFSDVSDGSWYDEYIGWAVEAGLAKGYSDGTFLPDTPISRAEFAALVCRMAEYSGLSLPGDSSAPAYSDANLIPEWARSYVEALRFARIFEGDENRRFNASDNLTRAEAATISARLHSLIAADPMYSAARNLSGLLITESGRIKLTFGSADTLTEENFSKLILRNQLGLDTDKYGVDLDNGELDRLKDSSAYGGVNDGGRFDTELKITIVNKESGERTGESVCKFRLVRDDSFDPDRGPVYEYKRMADGSCEITGVKDSTGWTVLEIPAELNGRPVSSIGDEAFAEMRRLRQVTVPEGVKAIGSRAFALCTSLEQVTFPESLTTVRRGAFYYCSSLTHVELPQSLERIPDYMFYMCTSLKRVRLPEAAVEIGTFAFNHTALSDIFFYEGLEKIGDYSFEGSSVTTAVLPESCKYLGSWAFLDCKTLSRAYLNKDLEFAGSCSFYGCDGLAAIDYGGSASDWKEFGTGLLAPVLDGKPVNYNVPR